MPAIWNVGNTQGYNNKKISSKLTFEEGETFKGRVVAKGDEDSVTVKLTDGWEFTADLLEGAVTEDGQLVKFKVEGFEDGKIKLKVVNDLAQAAEEAEDDVVNNFINKEGVSKDDFEILKAMVKFNISLSKDNIDFVKSVFKFSEKLNNQKEIDQFINNYISGKNLDVQSPEALAIKEKLTEFFEAFKTMSKEDILLFLENDIDINTENIESYNKLFKGDVNLKEYFEGVSKEFDSLNLEKGIINKTEIPAKEIDANTVKEDNSPVKYSQKQNMGFKVYDDNSSSKSTVSLLNLLKTITGTETNVTKDAVKNVFIENKALFKGNELSEVFSKIDNMSEDELSSIFKEAISNKGLTKETLNSVLNQLCGKEVQLSDNEASKLKDILNLKLNNTSENIEQNSREQQVKNEGSIFQNDKQVHAKEEEKNIFQTGNKITSSMLIKHELNGKVQDMKDVIKQLLSSSEQLRGKTLEGKVAEFIKNNLNDFKLFNTISNEYYYLDVPIDRHNKEYPCKLIIKDDRKGNKQIDSTNVKMVVAVKTVNMGTVDAYLTVAGNTLNVDIKCIEKFVKLISRGTNQLNEKLSQLGYSVNISVHEKIDEVNLSTCRDFFDSGSDSALDIKV